MITSTPNQTKEILKYALYSDDSVLINGKHGIGKTSVVKQFAKENNLYLETLILSLKDPSDLLGMPFIDQTGTNKRTKFAEPDWFQNIIDKAWPVEFYFDDLEFHDSEFEKFLEIELSNSGEKISRDLLNELYSSYYKENRYELNLTKNQNRISCKKSQSSVIFLDELNRAFLDTRQCSLQLVLEKELHSHKLPFVKGKRTFICAAINPSDIYQTDELDIALLDRFLIVDMIINTDDWIDYSKQSNVNSIILEFISENPDKLHYMTKDCSSGSTPRSWEKLSSYLYNLNNSQIDFDILKIICCGKLGKEVGTIFFNYYKNHHKLLKVENLIEKVYSLYNKKTISEISFELNYLMQNTETIRKRELLNQLFELAETELLDQQYNIISITLLSYLSSLNFEISTAFCKKLKNTNPNLYTNLVKLDESVNNKEFFKKLVNF